MMTLALVAMYTLSSCSSIPKVTTVDGTRGSIIEADEVTMLDSAGGVLRTTLDGIDGDIVITKKEGRLVAVLPRCTHEGCTVDLKGVEYVCPCDGSRFALNGQRIAGLAEDDLSTFTIERLTPKKIRILR